MAAKKTSKSPLPKVNLNLPTTGRTKELFTWFMSLSNLSHLLSIIFYIIWIPVGIFFLWFIVANFRLGAFDQLMGAKRPPTVQGEQAQVAETEIPGVGRVNVACVQGSLSEESIMTIVNEKSDASLSEEDKEKLKNCLVEEASESPAPTE